MWYFTWMLGIGFAVMISILNALWGEFEQDRDRDSAHDRSHDQGSDQQDDV